MRTSRNTVRPQKGRPMSGKLPHLAEAIMTRVFAVALFALVLPAVSAAEPLPWSLNQRWECSAGHRNTEWLHSFSPDGKLALFAQRSGNLIARDTTSWLVAEKLQVIEPKAKPRYGSVVA